MRKILLKLIFFLLLIIFLASYVNQYFQVDQEVIIVPINQIENQTLINTTNNSHVNKINVYQLLDQINILLDSEAKQEIIKIIQSTKPDIPTRVVEYFILYEYVYLLTTRSSLISENSFQLTDALEFLKAPKFEPSYKYIHFNSDIYFNFAENLEKIQNEKIKIWILQHFNQELDVRILKHFDIESLFIPIEPEIKPKLMPIKQNHFYHGNLYNFEYLFIAIGGILFITSLLS